MSPAHQEFLLRTLDTGYQHWLTPTPDGLFFLSFGSLAMVH